MSKNLTLILSVALLFMVAACNPYTSWDKTVVNDSSKSVILYTTDSGGGFTFTDSVIIGPSSSFLIYSFGDITKIESADCDLFLSRLSVQTDTGFVITKDIQDPNNWTSNTKSTDEGYDHSCIYTITDADIN